MGLSIGNGQSVTTVIEQWLADESATGTLACRFAAALPEDTTGWTILLEGELGAGKSTFVRAMLRSMGHEGSVPSPTYTLVEPYTVSGRAIYHIDLYRINSEEELYFLGWSDSADGLRMVEWPDRAPGLAAGGDIRIRLAYGRAADESGRSIEIEAISQRANKVVAAMGDPGSN